jgi:hypothetical protein
VLRPGEPDREREDLLPATVKFESTALTRQRKDDSLCIVRARSFQNTRRVASRAGAGWILIAAFSAGAAWADGRSLAGQAGRASLAGGVRLERGIALVSQDVALTCFQDSLTLILNPGCFNPPTAGDCRTRSTQYFAQYFTPDLPMGHRVKSIAFISNDAATVFPSAGIVLIPTADNRFPTPAELAGLQVTTNIKATQDTSVVVVDLQAANIVVPPATDVVVCLQFPEGQQLTAVGVGPGIVVDEVLPNQNCDFLTGDGGANWFRPADNDPLDWGFEVVFEPLAVEAMSWSAVKALFGAPRVFPYSTP